MQFKIVDKIEKISGKRVLVRLDCDVPLRRGAVVSDWRLQTGVKTLQFLLKKGARVIVIGHAGRPGGKKKAALSLKNVSDRLSKLLDAPVRFVDSIPSSGSSAVTRQKKGTVLFLENLRFYKGEEKNTKVFAKKLASLADVYVNEAFAMSHREHASVALVPTMLPAYIGFHFQKEIAALSKVMRNPKKPVVAIFGGAKVETKLPALLKMVGVAQSVLVGGKLSLSYLAERGLLQKKYGAGNLSIRAERLLKKRNVRHAVDVVVGTEDGQQVERIPVKSSLRGAIGKERAIYDIGPETIIQFGQEIEKAKTIIWNGAMGVFEQHPYEYGTMAVARMIAAAAHRGVYCVAGGGDTIASLEQAGVRDMFSHISTGGGAMLAFLAEENLPAIDALQS